jgi:SAM-dependent methyltransferase
MAEQAHQSAPLVLNRRTLSRDHPRLLQFLRPGMSVLDVGCGTGAITRGIAEAVGTQGRVVGVDCDISLLEIARHENAAIPNLVFEVADAAALPFEKRFDIVTAARTVQWVNRPQVAIEHMCRAAKTGGRVVALDYNHSDNSWHPEPPDAFLTFYSAFLRWRELNGWDNRIADALPAMFRACELREVEVWADDEITLRDSPEFTEAALIWAHVVNSLGPQLVTAGFLTEETRSQAEESYRTFAATALERQTLSLKTVAGLRA